MPEQADLATLVASVREGAFNRAERFALAGACLRMLAFVLGVAATFDGVSWVIAVVGTVAAFSAVGVSWTSGTSRQEGERTLRLEERVKVLGMAVSRTEVRELNYAPKVETLRVSAGEYWSEKGMSLDERFAKFRESAWYSQKLAMIQARGLAAVALSTLAAGALALLVAHKSGSMQVEGATVLGLIVAAIVQLGLLKLVADTFAASFAARDLLQVGDSLAAGTASREDELSLLLADYWVARASWPLILNLTYDRHRERLDAAWKAADAAWKAAKAQGNERSPREGDDA